MLYAITVVPLGRSVSGILRDLQEDERFQGTQFIFVARLGDEITVPDSIEALAVLTVQRNGSLIEGDLDRYHCLIDSVMRGGDDRLGFVLNGGTTPQQACVFHLWHEEDSSGRDGFDVQRDGVNKLVDDQKKVGN